MQRMFLAVNSLSLVLLAGGALGQGDPAETYSGSATTYDLGTSTGACGFRAAEVAPFYAAMNGQQHASGEWCGAWVKVTGPGGTALVQIVDKAPELTTGNLDLGPQAFTAVTGASGSGIFPITWHWVSAPGNLGPIHFYSQGSNPYYLKLQAANIVNPVKKMEILQGGSYVAMTRTTDNYYEFTGTMIVEPFTIRVTDVRNNLVVSTGLTIAATAGGQNGGGNFPAVVEPVMVVEQPSGTVVADGGTRNIGYSIDGSTSSLTFVIRNTGAVALSGIAITKDGANAADFTVTSPAATIAAGGTSSFVVSFATSVVDLRSAHLAISSSAGGPYDITLSGRGISAATDSDSDGMNDAAEVKLAALGFDWQVAQPGLVGTYYDHASTAGLYTVAQVQALNAGTPLIQRNSDGRFKLTLGLWKSTDLAVFTPFPFTAADVSVNAAGKIEFNFAPAGNAAFFRLGAE